MRQRSAPLEALRPHAALVLVALAAPATAQPTNEGGLAVVVEPGQDCPTEQELLTALQEEFGRDAVHAAPRGEKELVITVRRLSQAELLLQLRDQGSEHAVQRQLSVSPDECAEVPYSIVLMLRTWAQQLSWAELAPRHTPTLAYRASRVPRQRRHVAPRPPQEPTPAPTPESVAPQSEATPPVDLPPVPAATQTSPASLPLFVMRATILGGGSIAYRPTQPAWQEMLQLEARFADRFGVALQVGAQSELRAAATPGIVSAASQQATLLATVSAVKVAGGAGRVLAGIGIERTAAHSEGYVTSTSVVVHQPAASLGVQWEQNLLPGLFVVGGVQLNLRFAEERFDVDGLGTVLALQALRVGFFVGVGSAL